MAAAAAGGRAVGGAAGWATCSARRSAERRLPSSSARLRSAELAEDLPDFVVICGDSRETSAGLHSPPQELGAHASTWLVQGSKQLRNVFFFR